MMGILFDRKVVRLDILNQPEDLKKLINYESLPGNKRVVAFTVLNRFRHIHVSTVFLSIDHSFYPGEELWFETMVFGTSIDGFQRRYETWEEAEKGHWQVLKRAKQARQTRNQHWNFNYRKSMKKIMKKVGWK